MPGNFVVDDWNDVAGLAALLSIAVALVSSFVGGLGLAAEALRRRWDRGAAQERIAAALRAEAQAFQAGFDRDALLQNRDDVVARFEADPSFHPYLMRQAYDLVFRSQTADLGLLPASALVPVLEFYGQIDRIGHAIDDLRSDQIQSISSARRAAIYDDYIAMVMHGVALAKAMEDSLDAFLGDSA